MLCFSIRSAPTGAAHDHEQHAVTFLRVLRGSVVNQELKFITQDPPQDLA